MLGFCSFVEFSFFVSSIFSLSFFKIILIFKNLFWGAFIPLFSFPTVLFPLQLIFNVYKSSSSTYI